MIKGSLEKIVYGAGAAGILYRLGRSFEEAYVTAAELVNTYLSIYEITDEMKKMESIVKLVAKQDCNIIEIKKLAEKIECPTKEGLMKKLGEYEKGELNFKEIRDEISKRYFDLIIERARLSPQCEAVIKKYEGRGLCSATFQSFIHYLVLGSKRFN